ncbi:MAG: YadA-like family protein [Gammaproteobacteria bacterium]|nr:YadA-like family protein [Gammaproteobacteria bacterium]
MNKVYKVVWCEKTQTMVAVSEFAKSKGKSSSKSQLATHRSAVPHFRLAKIALALMSVFGWQAAMASTVQNCVFDSNSAELICDDGSTITPENQTLTLFNEPTTQPTISTFAATPTTYANITTSVNNDPYVKWKKTNIMGGDGAKNIDGSVEASNNNIIVGNGAINKPLKKLGSSNNVIIGQDAVNNANAKSGKGDSVIIGHGAKTDAYLDNPDFNPKLPEDATTNPRKLTTIARLDQSTVIGAFAEVGGNRKNTQQIAIGPYTKVTGDQAIAIGANTIAKGNSSIVIGGDDLDIVAHKGTLSWDNELDAAGFNNSDVATEYKELTGQWLVGGASDNDYVLKTEKIVTVTENGQQVTKTYEPNRFPATTTGEASVAIGVQSRAVGNIATAVGTKSFADGFGSTAFGVGATASRENSVALGAGSQTGKVGDKHDGETMAGGIANILNGGVNVPNTVAIDSMPDFVKETEGLDQKQHPGKFSFGTKAIFIKKALVHTVDANGLSSEDDFVVYESFAGGSKYLKPGDQVSVGSYGYERQIKNVAPGVVAPWSTDAINGSQLSVFAGAFQGKLNALNNKADLPLTFTGNSNQDTDTTKTWNVEETVTNGLGEVTENGKTITVMKDGDKWYKVNPATGKIDTTDATTEVADANTVQNKRDRIKSVEKTAEAYDGTEIKQGEEFAIIGATALPADATAIAPSTKKGLARNTDTAVKGKYSSKNVQTVVTNNEVQIQLARKPEFDQVKVGTPDPTTGVIGSPITIGPVTENGAPKNRITGLDDSLFDTTTTRVPAKNPTDADLNAVKGNVATVNDILNSGWNLQGDSTAVDFVNPYDTVNFVDGAATNVTVESVANKNKKENKIKFDVLTDNTTIEIGTTGSTKNKLKAKTTTLTPSATAGTVTAGDTTSLVTGKTVADAINGSFHKVTNTNTDTLVTEGTGTAKIKAGDTITFEAGKNLSSVMDDTGLLKVSTKDEVKFTKVTVGDNTDSVVINKNNITGINTILPVNTTSGEKPDVTNKTNNAASLGDVLNAGWNLQVGGTAADFVQPYDTVNFIGGNGVTVTEKTDSSNDTNTDIVIAVATGTVGSDTTANNGTTTGTTGFVTGEQVSTAINNAYHTVKNTDTENLVTKAEGSTKIKAGSDLTIEAGKNLASAMVNESGLLQISTKDEVVFKKVTLKDGTNDTVLTTTANGLNVGGDKITNVAAGKNDTDAVNVKQLKASKEVVKSTDKTVTVNDTQKTADGAKIFDLSIQVDDATLAFVPVDPAKPNGDKKLAPKTTTLTNTDGKVADITDEADKKKLITAGSVADAINNSGFKLDIAGNTGTDTTTDSKGYELINPGDTIKIIGGDHIKVSQNLGEITIETDNQAVAESAQLPVVYTKEDGTKVYLVTKNGKKVFNTKPDGKGDDVDKGDVIASMNNADGTTATPTALTNVKSTLPNTVDNPIAVLPDNPTPEQQKDYDEALANAKKSQAAPTFAGNEVHNAATISDVLSAGWNLQGDSTAVDFVKPYDTVNFVDGDGTNAIVTTDTDNKVSTIKFDVLTDNTTIETVAIDPNDASKGTQIKAKTTTLTPSTTDGTVTAGDTNNLVKAGDIATAINGAGFKAKTETGEGGADELITMGDTLIIDEGKNIDVVQAANKFTIKTKENVEFTSVKIGNATDNTMLTSTDQGLSVGGDTITNVGSGLKKADGSKANTLAEANQTNAVNVGDLLMVSNEAKVKSVETVSAGDGVKVKPTGTKNKDYEVSVNADTDTLKFINDTTNLTNGKKLAVNTGDIVTDTANKGKVKPKQDDAKKVANVADVADAINSAGWIAKTTKRDNLITELDLVTAGNSVNFVEGNGIVITPKADANNSEIKIAANIDNNTIKFNDDGELFADIVIPEISKTTGTIVLQDDAEHKAGTVTVAKDDAFLTAGETEKLINGSFHTVKATNNATQVQAKNGSVQVSAGDTLDIVAGKNLNANMSNDGTLQLSTASDVEFDNVAVKKGLTVAPKANVDMGGNQIHHVAPGRKPDDAVNVSQLQQSNQNLYKSIDGISKENKAGIAGSAAIAMLGHARDSGQSAVSAGVAFHEGQGALAIGVSAWSDNGHWLIKGALAQDTRSQTTVGASATYSWD